jgi:hypothetical protein
MSSKNYCDNCNREGKVCSVYVGSGPFVIGIKLEGFGVSFLDFCPSCLLEFQRKHRQHEPVEQPKDAPVACPPPVKKKGLFR